MSGLNRSDRAMLLACVMALACCVGSWAQEFSRGLRYHNLTVSPYVNLEYMYDSNVNYQRGDEQDDHILRIQPGVDLSYRGNDWGLSGGGWYARDSYWDNDRLNANRYGQNLEIYRESAKGWKAMLGQRYVRSNQDDSMTEGGRGLWRDRTEWSVTSALSYDFSERTSATLNAMYSDLSYENETDRYGPLFGWQQWSVGLQLARQLTARSNLLLSGSGQQYSSDGARGISDRSSGYTLQAGFGSRATERIRYRLLAGASMFDYAGEDQLYGWTYSADASWVINPKLAASLAGSSNFQPSEREVNQAMKYYALSAGLTYRPMRRLSTRFDVAYRCEDNEYDRPGADATTDHRYSLRLRADYRLQRYLSLYGGVEYENQFSDDKVNEFDRFRVSLGLNLRY